MLLRLFLTKGPAAQHVSFETNQSYGFNLVPCVIVLVVGKTCFVVQQPIDSLLMICES